MKKILYVLPSLGAGGAERAAILVANELTRKHGCDISFFLFTTDLYNRQLLDPGTKIFCNDLYDERSWIRRVFSTYVSFGCSLHAHLKNNDYDVVVSGYEINGELPILEAIVANALCLRKTKTTYVSVIQNSLKGSGLPHAGRRSAFVLSMIAYLRWRLFTRIIAVAPTIRDECPEYIRNDIVVISNPADRSYIIDKSREPFPAPGSEVLRAPYFINIARISHQKNQLCLVRAFNAIKEKTDWNLVLIGHITDKGYYLKIGRFIRDHGLQERIFLLGTPANPYAYLGKAEAFVFSSRYEGNPIAVIEAMVLKKVIVSTKFIGYENILSARNAVLVENENERQLAEAMVHIAGRTMDYEPLIENAFTDTAKFDISTIAEQYHACFSAL